jgi:hypothetical protein
MPRKTLLMKRVEDRYGEDLEELLPRLVMHLGGVGAAEELDVSKATLNYWLLKLRLRVQRVVLRPGERVEIVKEER